ncbi:hypothetical protein [Thiocapsa imhoffii]|uniref:hypothetical protein n=1 Tax=Thiocapsa imhoffii TaxID=382777 RepID=UPI001903E82F|nr:hypothetical protein [Thiocapsa imhoffii]
MYVKSMKAACLVALCVGLGGTSSAFAAAVTDVTWDDASSSRAQLFSGNDSNFRGEIFGLTIGSGDGQWNEIAKVNIPESWGGSFTVDGLTVTSDNLQWGDWSFNGSLDFERVMLVVKAGNNFAAYEFGGDAPVPTSGSWLSSITNQGGANLRSLPPVALQCWPGCCPGSAAGRRLAVWIGPARVLRDRLPSQPCQAFDPRVALRVINCYDRHG